VPGSRSEFSPHFTDQAGVAVTILWHGPCFYRIGPGTFLPPLQLTRRKCLLRKALRPT
jgi:hypothetical protein